MSAPSFDEEARAYLRGLTTLEEVHPTSRAVYFVGRRPDGARVLLEVLRPLWLSKGYYLLPDFVQPAELTVYQGTKGERPTGCFSFAVYEDTPKGAALCAVLEGLPL